MKIALVHNPNAGSKEVKTEDLVSLLGRSGHTVEAVALCNDLPNTPAVRRAELAVIAGGDGTLRKVALQFAHHPMPLTALPVGTANNIATSLGIVGPPEKIVAGWGTARRRKIDVGVARGPWGERFFLEGIGLGLVGRSIGIIEEIDESAPHSFKEPEDKLLRDLSVFLALAHELPAERVGCWIDGDDFSDDYLLLEILNIRHAGPRIELAADADPGDGAFDVVAASSRNRNELKESLKRSLSRHESESILPSRPARNIRLALTTGELRIDDEVVLDSSTIEATSGKPVSIEIEVVPSAVTLMVPAHPDTPLSQPS